MSKLKTLIAHPAWILGALATTLSALISTGVIPTSGNLHNVVAGILAGLAAAGFSAAHLMITPSTTPPTGS